jgi:hypothetical protein
MVLDTMVVRGTECWCRLGCFDYVSHYFVLLVMTPDSKELGWGLPSSKKMIMGNKERGFQRNHKLDSEQHQGNNIVLI